ncbi:hypothetical protein BDV19DRAFT_370625 [Aspergillus venezuelensis]
MTIASGIVNLAQRANARDRNPECCLWVRHQGERRDKYETKRQADFRSGCCRYKEVESRS